jgi:hypothetical protein
MLFREDMDEAAENCIRAGIGGRLFILRLG